MTEFERMLKEWKDAMICSWNSWQLTDEEAEAILDDWEPMFKIIDRQKRLHERFRGLPSRTQTFIHLRGGCGCWDMSV